MAEFLAKHQDAKVTERLDLRLIDAPGNVPVPKRSSGLPKDSVANVSQLVTLDRVFLTERTGKVPARLMAAVDAGLKLVLDLP